MKSFLHQGGYAVLELLSVVGLVAALAVTVYAFNNFNGDLRTRAGEDTQLAVFTPIDDSDVVNEDGGSFSVSGSHWLGTGENPSSSFLGLRLKGNAIPQGATISKAELKFTQPKTEWIGISFEVKAQDSGDPQTFSGGSKPSSRSTIGSVSFSSDAKWNAGETYSHDVTSVIQEYVNKYGSGSIVLIVRGTGTQWGRKFVYDGGTPPRLEVQYSISSGTSPTAAPTATATAGTPTASPTATATATSTPTPTPTATPTPTPTPTPTLPAGGTTQGGTGGSGQIFGLVSADVLGTCSAAVHDQYVTTGPDGKLYRTWHPAKDPSGCTFAHEHGDDPGTSNIFAVKVPFGYIASQLGMDEPHVGFKCFVHNKGQRNNEGSTFLHDAYYCFHMGTGGPARFTARFHSLDFHFTSGSGYKLNVQGMADVGNVGTICSNPRQRRTVQGFGCLLDSPYEIWENVLQIRNKGNVVATAIVSTAVFDPITSMDPADLSRTVYTWSDEAQQKIFKFKDPRDNYRGCNREAYTGPVNWYNRGGSQIYYTDPYGNVVDGGVLKQEVSPIVTNQNTDVIKQFNALRMTYKGSEEMTQFKYHKSACVSGLGIKN